MQSSDDPNKLSVKQRINQLELDPNDSANHDAKPRKQKPTSNAFAMFESKGIIIGPVRLHYLIFSMCYGGRVKNSPRCIGVNVEILHSMTY